jgi:hypothetical protein
MGGAFIKFDAGSVGSAADNAAYITRESAVDGGMVLHNAPDDVAQVKDPHTPEGWAEQRMRLQTWAETRETEEIARHGNRKGQPRTHYRVVLSYERNIETDEAQEDARKWLEEEFPEAKAVAVVHQDTENTHVHVWMSPRLEDGSKINISPQDFRDLTAEWDRIYERRMQEKRIIRRRGKRLPEKMEETRRFKQRFAELREQGASEAELQEWAEENRPDRANPPGPAVYRQRDRRRAGREELEAAKQRIEKSREKRVEQQLRNAKRKKVAAEQQIRQTEKAKEDRDKQESKTKNWWEESHERDEGRAGRDERGADGSRESAERGEQGSFEQSEQASKQESEARIEADRKSGRRAGRGRNHGGADDDVDASPDRSDESSGRDRRGQYRPMASGGRSESSDSADSGRRSSGRDLGRGADSVEQDGRVRPEEEGLSSSQQKILRLLRTIRKAEKDEDVSKEESNLDYKLGTTHSEEIQELREKMNEEQQKALDRFQEQYQERSRGR